MSLARIDLELACEVARLREAPQEVAGNLHAEFIAAELRNLVDELDELLADAYEPDDLAMAA